MRGELLSKYHGAMIDHSAPHDTPLQKGSSVGRLKANTVLSGIASLLLLIAFDRISGTYADYISRTLYRDDTRVLSLVARDETKIDTLIVGGCRASDNIDPTVVEREIGGSVFNAGKVVEGMGNIEFTLDLALSHHRPELVLIVLDDGNLEETLATTEGEAKEKIAWLPLMKDDIRQQFSEAYTITAFSHISRLWPYRGQGLQIARASFDLLRGKSGEESDGYGPRSSSQDIRDALSVNADEIRDDQRKDQSLSLYAQHAVKRLVGAVRAAGSTPVLIVAPMHYVHATDEANQKEFEIMKNLSVENDAALLFYPDNMSRLARTDIYWSDAGHMNQRGAEAFSKILSEDLLQAKAHNFSRGPHRVGDSGILTP